MRQEKLFEVVISIPEKEIITRVYAIDKVNASTKAVSQFLKHVSVTTIILEVKVNKVQS